MIPGLIGAALLWALLPPMVVAIDDDFWYLRSLLKTIWHVRPWTDEWLTPWSAATSSLSALLYWVSGSFRLAVNGSLVMMAGLAWAGFAWLHQARGLRTGVVVAMGWLVFLFPTQLFMQMMFTSVPLYWAALWWCLACAIRRKWTAFFVVWAMAVANRQSAAVWIAIPAWAAFAALWETRFRGPYLHETRFLAVGGALSVVWVLFLKWFMNPTMGQEMALNHLTQAQNLTHGAVPLGMAVCALCAGVGLGRLVTLVGLADAVPGVSIRRIAAMFAGASVGIVAALWFRGEATTTHACFATPGSATVFCLLGSLAGGAFGYSPPSLAPAFSIAALGAVALVVYYGGAFDYYHAEIAFLSYTAVLAAMPRRLVISPPVRAPLLKKRVLAAAIAVPLVWIGLWNGACAVKLRTAFEKGSAFAKLYEKALRDGSLRPDEIGFAPFGYLGWRLHDYHIARNEIRTLAGFIDYADAWDGVRGTSVITRYPPMVKRWREWIPSHNAVPLREHPEGRDIASIESLVLWKQPATFTLRRVEGAGRDSKRPRVDPDLYKSAPFPLSDKEWQELISSRSVAQPGTERSDEKGDSSASIQ